MSTLRRHALVLAAIASIASLAGCSGNKTACCEPAPSGDGKVAVINTMCPIGADDFETKERPASLVRTVNDQKIGFCCEGCVATFDKMSDDKKHAVLTAATANKAM